MNLPNGMHEVPPPPSDHSLIAGISASSSEKERWLLRQALVASLGHLFIFYLHYVDGFVLTDNLIELPRNIL